MGKIPTFQRTENARRAGVLTHSEVGSDAFGGQVGSALRGLGGNIGDLGGAVKQFQDEKERTEANIAIANMTGEAQSEMIRLTHEAPADGSGIVTGMKEFLDTKGRETKDRFKSKLAQDRVRVAQATLGASLLPRALDREATKAAQNAKTDTKEALENLYRGVQIDPTTFGEMLEQGETLIKDHFALEAPDRKALGEAFRENLASYYFSTVIDNAETLDMVEAARLQMETSPAGQYLKPEALRSYQKQLLAQERAIKTGLLASTKADAEAMIAHLGVAGSTTTPEEITDIVERTIQYGSPALRRKLFEAIKTSDAMKALSGSTREELKGLAAPRQPIRAQKGSGKTARQENKYVLAASRAADIGVSYFQKMFGVENSTFDPKRKNDAGASSAEGLGQVIDSTWIGLMDRYAASYFGVDVSKMTKAQKLAYRRNGMWNAIMTGLFTAENKAFLKKHYRDAEPSDEELYMAHFLGAGGAVRFLKAMDQGFGDSHAWQFVDKSAVAANPTIFFVGGNKKKPRTLNQMFELMASKLDKAGGSSSRTASLERTAADKMLKSYDEGMKKDGSAFVQEYVPQFFQDDEFDVTTGAGIGGRAKGIFAANDYLGEDVPLLTKRELDQLNTRLDDMSVEDKIAYATTVHSELGGEATEFFKLLKPKQFAMSWAGMMMANGADEDVAFEVMRGQQVFTARGKDGKPQSAHSYYKTDLDAEQRVPEDIAKAFLPFPQRLDEIQKAADLAYAYRTRFTQEFNADEYRQTMLDVAGGIEVDNVNGTPTILPPGVTGDMMEDALDNITTEHLTKYSVGGGVPVYQSLAVQTSDGSQEIYRNLDPDDMGDKVYLEMESPDTYLLRVWRDGGYLFDSQLLKQDLTDDEMAYRIKLSAENVTELASLDGGLIDEIDEGPGMAAP